MARYSTLSLSFLRPFAPSYSPRLQARAMSHDQANLIKYKWIDGVETLEHYVPGGYHPVMIGDVLHDRYRIVDKLGFGGYSTVWLARDSRYERYVALKVGIAHWAKDALLRETSSLRALSAPLPSPASREQRLGHGSIPCLLDQFEVHGPNGMHVCYTTTPARCNLHEVSYSRLFPLDVARALSGGLALALAYTHSRGYVHGGWSAHFALVFVPYSANHLGLYPDIQLQNIFVKLPSGFNALSINQLYEKYGKPATMDVRRKDGEPLPPNIPPKAVLPLSLGKKAQEFTLADVRVLLSDFGEAFAPATDIRPGKASNIPLAFQPPEVRFEPDAPLTFSSDIWSLATAIWEIIGMKAIFSTDWVTEDEMTAQHIDELGPMPLSWWDRWEKRGEFFDENVCPIEGREVWPPLDQAFEDFVQVSRRKRGMGEFGKEETVALLQLMQHMLAYLPEDRPTVEEVLKSEWMVKWVMPDFERSLRAQQ
ncbi:hypothetical protein FQN50_008269 [Emmonsiellopsis sp. PD_5]|nr:hypothetical protein FQN50_008269 [Emmonsiellopsis sp. PD_5]